MLLFSLALSVRHIFPDYQLMAGLVANFTNAQTRVATEQLLLIRFPGSVSYTSLLYAESVRRTLPITVPLHGIT